MSVGVFEIVWERKTRQGGGLGILVLLGVNDSFLSGYFFRKICVFDFEKKVFCHT